jgi:kinesin family protein 5
MNSESSRSHCLVQVRLDQWKEGGNYRKSSRLNLVDLAGSEKIKKTGAKGSALKEAQNINKSLSALGKIIRMLSDGQVKEMKKSKDEGGEESGGKKKNNRRKTNQPKGETHIPYRDSKLTRLLQNSLGGNTKTMLLVACKWGTCGGWGGVGWVVLFLFFIVENCVAFF